MELPKGKSFLLCLMISVGFLCSESEARVQSRIKGYENSYTKEFLKKPILTSSQVTSNNKTSSNCSNNIPSWSDKNCILGPYYANIHLLPSFFKQFCPQPYGKFQVEMSCRLYVTCYNGSLTVNRCSNSTFFNSSVQSCITSFNSKCVHSSDTSDKNFVSNLLGETFDPKEAIGKEESNGLQVNFGLGSQIRRLQEIERTDDKRSDEKIHDDIWRSSVELSKTSTTSTWSNVSSSSPQTKIHEEFRSVESPSKTESKNPKGLLEVPMCANSSNDIFSHPQSCGHFFQCVSGKVYIQTCDQGTVFNSRTLVCDWAANVPECDDRRSNHIHVQDNRVKRSTVDNNNIILETNALLTPRGKGAKISNQIHSRKKRDFTRHKSKKCGLSENYIQPHPMYCNKLEICSNGRITEQTCGVGAVFNPLSLVCDFPANVDCQSRMVDYSTYGCEKDHKYRTLHPEDCDKFIECDKGDLHVKTCPPATVYNWEEEECDHVYKSKCKEPISFEHDTDVNFLPRISRSSQQNSLNLACDFNYIAPHPQYCNKFVECEDRRIFIKSCGPGTVFNEKIGQCDWAYNTRKQHPDDCSRYLQCEGGIYTVKQCLRNTVFSPRTSKCVFSQYGVNECRNPKPTEESPILIQPPPS